MGPAQTAFPKGENSKWPQLLGCTPPRPHLCSHPQQPTAVVDLTPVPVVSASKIQYVSHNYNNHFVSSVSEWGRGRGELPWGSQSLEVKKWVNIKGKTDLGRLAQSHICHLSAAP